MLIVFYPILVSFVEPGDIVYSDALLIVPAPFLDLAHEVRNGRTEINQKVRRIDQGHHKVKKVGIVFKITGGHKPHTVEIRGENACILVNGPVLNDYLVALGDIHHILETLVEKINLKIERPALHIFVEISKIRIVVNGFEFGSPFVLRCQHPGQSGFSAADVSGYCYMHNVTVLANNSFLHSDKVTN